MIISLNCLDVFLKVCVGACTAHQHPLQASGFTNSNSDSQNNEVTKLKGLVETLAKDKSGRAHANDKTCLGEDTDQRCTDYSPPYMVRCNGLDRRCQVRPGRVAP